MNSFSTYVMVRKKIGKFPCCWLCKMIVEKMKQYLLFVAIYRRLRLLRRSLEGVYQSFFFFWIMFQDSILHYFNFLYVAFWWSTMHPYPIWCSGKAIPITKWTLNSERKCSLMSLNALTIFLKLLQRAFIWNFQFSCSSSKIPK